MTFVGIMWARSLARLGSVYCLLVHWGLRNSFCGCEDEVLYLTRTYSKRMNESPQAPWLLANYTYNDYSEDLQLTSVTDAENRTTEYFHDNLGRLTDVKDPLGIFTHYDFDIADRLEGGFAAVSGSLFLVSGWSQETRGCRSVLSRRGT